MSAPIQWSIKQDRDESVERFGMDGVARYGVVPDGTTTVTLTFPNMTPAEGKNLVECVTRMQKGRGYDINGKVVMYDTPKPIGPVVTMDARGIVQSIDGSPLIADGVYEIDSETAYGGWYRTAKNFYIRKINKQDIEVLPPTCAVCKSGHRIIVPVGEKCTVCEKMSKGPSWPTMLTSPANEANGWAEIEGLLVQESWLFPEWSETEFKAWYRTSMGEFLVDKNDVMRKLMSDQSICRNGHILKAGSWCTVCGNNKTKYPSEEVQREWTEQQLKADRQRAAERTVRAQPTRDLILDD